MGKNYGYVKINDPDGFKEIGSVLNKYADADHKDFSAFIQDPVGYKKWKYGKD